MTNKSRTSSYALNAIANGLGVVFVAAVSFFLSPFIVRHLGPTLYGVWSLTAGLVGYLSLLDLGIRQAVSRYVAHNYAASNHDESSLIVSAALRLFAFLGVLAILLSVILAYLAPIIFNVPEALASDVRTIVILGGVSVAVSLITGVFGGVVTGLERFGIQCCIEILVTVIRSVAIVIALRADHGLIALAVIQLSTQILSCFLYWLVAHKIYAMLKIRWLGALGPQLRTILSFSATLTVLHALGRIIYHSDAAVIGASLPIDAVTFFVIAGSLCMYAKEVPRSLSYLMTPRVSAMMSAGSNRVGEVIQEASRIATLASAPIALTFILRGESFIALWMGPVYGPLSGEVLRILAIAVWLDGSRSVITLSITGMAKHHTLIPGVAVEALCNLVLSIVLVRYLGIVGVALGTVIPGVLISLLYIPRSLSKATSLHAGAFLRKAVLVPTIACLPFGFATLMIERFFPASNLAIFFLQVLLVLPLAPATAWFLCLNPAERAQVIIGIRKALKR